MATLLKTTGEGRPPFLGTFTPAQIDALNADVAGGSMDYTIGSTLISSQDGSVLHLVGKGADARFIKPADTGDVSDAVAAADAAAALAAQSAQDAADVLVGAAKKVELAAGELPIRFTAAGAGSAERTLEQKARDVINIRDKGGMLNGTTNDAPAAASAFTTSKRVTIDNGTALLRQLQLPPDAMLDGGAELVQDTVSQYTAYAGSSTETNPANFPERVTYFGMRFGAMPVSASDDFGATGFFGVKRGSVIGGHYRNTENAVVVGAPDALFGTALGSTDTLILGTTFYKVRRYVIQTIQASYGRYIGISADNDGDNTYSNAGVDTGVNNGGNNMGVRIAANGRGNLLASSCIRDKTIAVSYQAGQEHSLVSGVYVENTLQEAYGTTSGSSRYRNTHMITGALIRDTGGQGVNLRYMNHAIFSGLVDGTGRSSAATQKHGIDLYSELGPADETWFIPFSGGSGVVPAVGTTISQGSVSSVLMGVYATNAYGFSAAGATMPATGTIQVKSKTGGLFIAGALTGVAATATRAARCGDGRHRIDATVTGSGSIGVRVGSNKNLLTLLVDEPAVGPAAEITGSNNVVTIQAADGLSNAGATIEVSGANNTIFVNESSGRAVGLVVTGPGNSIYGNISGNLQIAGANTTLVGRFGARCDISAAGTGTTIVGEVVGVFTDASTGGNYRGMKGGMARGSVTASTNSNGQIAVTHGLRLTAATFMASNTRATPYLLTTKANNSFSTALVTFYTLAGAVLANTAVTFDWEAQV